MRRERVEIVAFDVASSSWGSCRDPQVFEIWVLGLLVVPGLLEHGLDASAESVVSSVHDAERMSVQVVAAILLFKCVQVEYLLVALSVILLQTFEEVLYMVRR